MAKDIADSIILGVLTIIGSLIISAFTPGSLLIHPTFDISTDKFPLTNTTQIHTIKVTNTGLVQAKNVQIDILSMFDEFKVVKAICPEGNILQTGNWSSTVKINLSRLSVNVECDINLENKLDQAIYDVVVTADNSPASKWSGQIGQTKTLSDPLNVAIIIATMAGLVVSMISFIKKSRTN